MTDTRSTTRNSELVKVAAANIRRIAGEKGRALAHIADAAGVGRTTMWRLLDANDKGASDPRLSTIEALAKALDVDPLALLKEHTA